MSEPTIEAFCANPYTEDANEAVIQNDWSFNNLSSSEVQQMYLYVSKKGVASGDSISSTIILPKLDTSGNLTRHYMLDNTNQNLTFPLVIGETYEIILQVIYKKSGSVQGITSNTQLVVAGSIPSVPNFTLQYSNDVIRVVLKNAQNQLPIKNSEFDGYIPLTGAMVTFSSGTNLKSQFFDNSNNRLYDGFLDISAVTGTTYEVSVATYNFTEDPSCSYNGELVSYGGRSAVSESQLITVLDVPSTPQNFEVYETMRDSANSSTYSYVSNTLKWENPTYPVPAELLSFQIYRNEALIHTTTDISGSSHVYSYKDESPGLVAGNEVTYKVAGVNANGLGLFATTDMSNVVFPRIVNFTATPDGSGVVHLIATPLNNGFNYCTYDFSYNGAATNNGTDNSFNATGLTNNQEYVFQARVDCSSNTLDSESYKSSWFDVSATPYDPSLNAPTNVDLSNIDVDGQPLDGKLELSWRDSSNATPIQGLMYAEIEIQVALPFQPWTPVAVVNGSEAQDHKYMITGLTNGVEYNVRVKNYIVNSILNQRADSAWVSEGPLAPFAVPGPVTSLQMDASGTGMLKFSYVAPVVPSIFQNQITYDLSLNNLNGGQTSPVNTEDDYADVSGSIPTVITGTSLDAGSHYELFVTPKVNGVAGQTTSVKAFTVPSGVTCSIENTDNSGNLLRYIDVSWNHGTNDPSNVSYNIYVNGKPTPSAQGIIGTEYLDSNLTVGVDYFYQVVPVVNGVEGEYVPGTTPSPSSPLPALQPPAQVTSATFYNVSINGFDVSWNASANGSGLADTELRYKVELIDPSGNLDTSANNLNTFTAPFTSLTKPWYEVNIYAGVEYNTKFFYNKLNPYTETIYLYNAISAPTLKLLPSLNALLSDWTTSDVSGLTFQDSTVELATDASFINVVKSVTLNSNEYYFDQLTNGILYYVRVKNNYTINNTIISSDWSTTQQTVPGPAPAQPQGLLVDASSANCTLHWDIPPQSAVNPSHYALCVSKDLNDIIPQVLTWIDLSNISSDVSQYFKNITQDNAGAGLVNGTEYYFTVIAGFQIPSGSGTTYRVSQPATSVSAVPYTTPTAVTNFYASSDIQSITLNWLPPDTNGGAGVGTNGPLKYTAEIARDASFNFIVSTVTNIANNVMGMSHTFAGLDLETLYSVRVRAYFNINNNPSTPSVGPWVEDLEIYTGDSPIQPGIIEIVREGTPAGKQVQLRWLVDSNFGDNSMVLKRTIKGPAGNVLESGVVVLSEVDISGTDLSSNNVYNHIDSQTSASFLNGNSMEYTLDISYNYLSGSKHFTSSTSRAAVPFGKPLATDFSGTAIDLSDVIIPMDMSGSSFSIIDVEINKNGSDLVSFVVLGLTPAGSTEEIPVLNVDPSTIIYNNPQVDSQIAANQYAKHRLNLGSSVTSVLQIQSNAVGTLITDKPYESVMTPPSP